MSIVGGGSTLPGSWIKAKRPSKGGANARRLAISSATTTYQPQYALRLLDAMKTIAEIKDGLDNVWKCLDKIADETEVRPGEKTIRGTDAGVIDVAEILKAVDVARADLRSIDARLAKYMPTKFDLYPPPGNPSQPPSWEDIERLARHYPVLQWAVTRVRRGELTREQALIAAVFALADSFQMMVRTEVDRLKNSSPVRF